MLCKSIRGVKASCGHISAESVTDICNVTSIYSTCQVGCLREVEEILLMLKITQTTNPTVNMTKTIGLWLMLF